METLSEPIHTDISNNQKLSLIIRSRALTLQGPWHLEDQHEAQGRKADLSGFPISFDYLITLQDSNNLIYPDDLPYVKQLVEELKEGKSLDYHFRVVTPAGEIKPLHGFGSLMQAEKGNSENQLADPGDIAEELELWIKLLKYSEQALNTGSWAWNLNTGKTFFSENFYRIFDAAPHALPPGRDSFLHHVHPEDRHVLEAALKTKESFQPLDLEYRIIRENGTACFIRDTGGFFTSREGQKYFIGTIQDITQQKQTLLQREVRTHKQQMGKLQETKDLLQKTLDAIPQMVWVTDAEGRIQFFNDCWFTYTGLSPEQIENYTLKDIDIFHPSQRKEIIPHTEGCIRLGIPYHGETLVRNHQYQYRWQINDVKPIHNDKGEVEIWVGTFTDVHDLFTSEKNLKENKELLEAVFNTTINGIEVFESVYDDSHEICDLKWKYHNRKAEEVFNGRNFIGKYLLEELPGMKSSGMFDKYREVIKAGKPFEIEHFYTFDGFANWFHVYVTNVEDNLIVTFQDITKRKLEEFELQESKHFIHEVADSTPDMLYITDLDNKTIVYFNKRASEIMGIDQKDVVEKGHAIFAEANHPLDYDKKMQHMADQELMSDDEVREIEVRLKVMDGSWRWFRIRTKVFKRKTDGTVWQTISLSQDIHDRKKAQEKIDLQHQINRQAEKIANIGNWEWNLLTGRLTWAENLFRMMELEPGTEPTLELFIRAIHPDDRQPLLEDRERVMLAEDGSLNEYQFRMVKKDGSIRYMKAVSELINRAGERLLIGTIRDVTEDVLLQQELKERVRFIETLIDSSVDGILVFDKELKLLVWNKVCEQHTGLSKEKILGKHILELFPHIKENKRLLEAMHKTLNGEAVCLEAETGIFDAGYYDVYYVPLQNDQSGAYAVLNIIHDISEKVKAQQELEALNRTLHQKNHELKSMNEELSTFAFIASHDLREPLRKIELFSDALMQREHNSLSDNGREFLRKMVSSIQRMNSLIDEILTFSRASAGSPKMLEFNLNQILDVVKSDLGDLLAERRVRLECQKLPVIYGNPLQFSQLLQHLIANAIKFQKPDNMPHIKISTAFVMAEEIGDRFAIPGQKYLKIEVKDNGIGFEEKYATKIFQMFQRLHGRSEFPGTGMGLAICKKVVENHHGFIVVKSTPGEGAVFSCYFPVK